MKSTSGFIEIAEYFGFDVEAFFGSPIPSSFDWGTESWIYVFQSGEYCKVGIARDVSKRLAQISKATPLDVKLLLKRSIPSFIFAGVAERAAHQMLSKYAHRNEWFHVEPEIAKMAVIGAHKATVAKLKRCKEPEAIDIGFGPVPFRRKRAA